MGSVFPLQDDTVSNVQEKVIRRMDNKEFALAVESWMFFASGNQHSQGGRVLITAPVTSQYMYS